jgi:hypothetical protein
MGRKNAKKRGDTATQSSNIKVIHGLNMDTDIGAVAYSKGDGEEDSQPEIS